jgi:TonB-dependent receptor
MQLKKWPSTQNKKLLHTVKFAVLCYGTTFMTPVYSQSNFEMTNQNVKSTNTKVVEEVVVTGVRSSIENSREAKRQAVTVIEAITAEDIGQFTDSSIAGALQRIPGVQIDVDNGGSSGDRVSIRGLGPKFVNSTVNGRRLLSSGDEARGLRKMNFNVFPSNILSGVQVLKGQIASGPESGLAGQVDLQTLRPLNMQQLKDKNVFGLVSVTGELRDLTDSTNQTINALGAWKNDNDDFAAFVSIVDGDSSTSNDQISQRYTISDIRLNTDGIPGEDTVIEGVTVPSQTNYTPNRSTAEKTAVSTGAQWNPTDSFEVVWDLTYSKYNNKSQRHQGQFLPGGAFKDTIFDKGAVIIDGNNVLQYADFSRAEVVGEINFRAQDFRYNNVTDNLISGVNFASNTERLKSSLDLFISKIDYEQDLRYPMFLKRIDESSYSYDATSGFPINTFGPELLLPGNVEYVQSVVREIKLDGDNHGLSLAFEYDLDWKNFYSLDFGINYDKTKISALRSAIAYYLPSDLNANTANKIAAEAVTGKLFSEGFFEGENISPQSWLISDFGVVGKYDPRVNNTGFDKLPLDPSASHHSEETITAFYGQLNLDSELNETPVSGNFGLRLVYTENTSKATALVTASDGSVSNSPISTGNEYTELLPSVNLNFALKESLALRAGFAKTLSRPEYEEMAPIISAAISENTTNPGHAVAGNPDLKPMMALNYDLTLEKYMENEGSAVLSIFYKDVSDFILDQLTLGVTVPGQGDAIFNTTKPVNFSDGEVKGLEVSLYQPFDMLFPSLHGFGMSANYTYVDSSFDKDVGDSGLGFPGSSKDNINLMAFYENEIITVRMSYIWRSKFFSQLSAAGSETTQARFTGETENLSLNVNYRPVESISVAFNASNLTNDARQTYIGSETTFLSAFSVGRTYNLTATYKY